MAKIVCSVCGSNDVQTKVWAKPNENFSTTTEFLDELIEDINDCWCCNCDGHQKLICIEESNDNN